MNEASLNQNLRLELMKALFQPDNKNALLANRTVNEIAYSICRK